ncbi:MAG: cytochrome P450 [Acidimicrobiia bacterium]
MPEAADPLAAVDLTDPAVVECPYPAYSLLREHAPVWRDPHTGNYIVTRHEDVRTVLLDPERFGSDRGAAPLTEGVRDDDADEVRRLYEEKGWLPRPSLARRDDPDHKAVRRLYDHAFRPARIKQMDDFTTATAHELIDDFVDEGRCEFVRQYSVPLPLILIGRQMGVPREDIWQIKAWTDAWMKRIGGMVTHEERLASIEAEIEAQHYFQATFERLRREPDDTLLSELVNTVIPEWGRPLDDHELHSEMMADTFVGGSETTTNALSHGLRLVIENPELWEALRADPESRLPTFAEELVRLASPVQGLFRVANVDVELAGVTIPAGSTVNVRFGSANHDERQFDEPEVADLERGNVRSHLGFGAGIHYCLGAPLARRELIIGFQALVERIREFRFAEGRNEFRHMPSLILRGLTELHVELTPL